MEYYIYTLSCPACGDNLEWAAAHPTDYCPHEDVILLGCVSGCTLTNYEQKEISTQISNIHI